MVAPQFSGDTSSQSFQLFDNFLKAHRLTRVEPVLAEREWLVGGFSVADILMADVLRLVDRFDGLAAFPACRAYVPRHRAAKPRPTPIRWRRPIELAETRIAAGAGPVHNIAP